MDNPQPDLISLLEAQQILRSRMPSFAGAIRSSMATWNSSLVSAQMVLDSSGRATILNQHWYSFANAALSEDSGVKYGINRLQRFFTIDERIILRFKLIDRNFNSKNYPTRRARDWTLQYPLTGLPRCERLELGYRLDITGTIIEDAFVMLRVGKTIRWVWQIAGSRIDTFPIQMALSPIAQARPTVFAYDNFLTAE